MGAQLLRWLGGLRRARWGKTELQLLTAWQMLQCRREAQLLCKQDDEAGLCLNACILARAAYQKGRPRFGSGAAVLQQLSAQEIETLITRYLQLNQAENPSCCQDAAQIAAYRDALGQSDYERLKWRVLTRFGVLPSERRAREMTDGDYLYCVLQMDLDDRQTRQTLCPNCRAAAELPRCPICGAPQETENPAFDQERFEELKKHERA